MGKTISLSYSTRRLSGKPGGGREGEREAKKTLSKLKHLLAVECCKRCFSILIHPIVRRKCTFVTRPKRRLRSFAPSAQARCA